MKITADETVSAARAAWPRGDGARHPVKTSIRANAERMTFPPVRVETRNGLYLPHIDYMIDVFNTLAQPDQRILIVNIIFIPVG
jgi:hypothetical protein